MKIFTRMGWTLLLAAAVVMAVGSGCGDNGSNPGGNNGGTVSVVDPKAVVRGTFTDARDGQKYKTVKIGSQTWMAQNLNYQTGSGSWCYGEGDEVLVGWDQDNDTLIYETLSPSEIQANCDTYGRLYDWATAMDIDTRYNNETWGGSDVGHRGVCPAGWHVSSVLEWDILMVAVGGTNIAGKKLKATSGWNYNGNNNDNGTDEFGFSALPGGLRDPIGSFGNAGGFYGYWWTATERGGGYAYHRNMGYNDDHVVEGNVVKSYAFSVRCLED